MSISDSDYSDEAEIRRLRNIAEQGIGLRFDNIVESGLSGNMKGIKSDHISFSQRLDSRTFFVQDDRYGSSREAGIFRGSNAEHLEIGRTTLNRLGIPTSEILDEKMIEEKTQAVELQDGGQSIRLAEVKKGRTLVRFSRQVDRFPVWSSNSIFGFTQDRQVGFMQVHWPEIPKYTVEEVHRLAHRLQRGWSVPEILGASVEAVEAGIIHSPAIAFFMDIYPVIRVIYRPNVAGKKPVLYFDRDAKNVPLPRAIDWKYEEKQQKSTARQRPRA